MDTSDEGLEKEYEELLFSLYHEPMPDYDWTAGKLVEIARSIRDAERKTCDLRIDTAMKALRAARLEAYANQVPTIFRPLEKAIRAIENKESDNAKEER